MRLRNIPGADAAITESVYCIKSPETHKGHWQEIFPSQQPLHIEIGMGKGRFMMDLAAAHPDINYLGIERYSSVLLRALQKMEENPLPNLFFICMDAADVAEVFDHGEVDRIYLNFSDPWPKDRHAKRRLTSRQFFARYDEVLAPEGVWSSRPTIRIFLPFPWRRSRKPAGIWTPPPEICITIRCSMKAIS